MFKSTLFALVILCTVYLAASQNCVTKQEILKDGSKKMITTCSDAAKAASSSVVKTAEGLVKSNQASASASKSMSNYY
jgi:hypothetical protein